MWWFLLIPMSLISGLLYYLGGESGWNTKIRDLGCNTIAVCMLMAHGFNGWSLWLTWFMLWGALTTYWKQGTDCKWYHWLFTGLGYGVSFLPYAVQSDHIIGWICYTVLLAISTCIWSEINDDVRFEASGRGMLIIIYLPALVI